jgi:hypothetical protein
VFGEGRNIRYTCKPSASAKKKEVVYILIKQWDGNPFTIKSIPADKVKRITSLSNNKTVSFESAPDGMLIKATDETSAIKSVAFRVETRRGDLLGGLFK